jgi:amidophosphoribosyltransferase
LLKEACGVLGIRSSNEEETSKMVYNGLMTLQHRGQESSGISILNKTEIHLKKFMGLVGAAFTERILSEMKGNVGLGHVRYSTVGRSSLMDAQPFKLNYPKKGIVLAHNGNLVNFMDLRRELSTSGRHLESTNDAEIITHLVAEELIKTKDVENAIRNVMNRTEGSYSAVFFTGEGDLIAFRDPQGFRPFCFGKNKNTTMFASESVALNINRIYKVEDVKPGEMIVSHEDQIIERKCIVPSKTKHCMFEYVYFSRPDSIIENKCVYDVRIRLGKNLAKTYETNADVIIPLPDTSRSAAEGISRETGLPVAEGLMKNRYIWRTFIMPSQRMRDISVNMKLNPIKSVIKNKHVLLVDDSIVRGTTTKKIVNLVRQVKAKKIDVWITCPPIISPCFYGIDISTHAELIAANNKVPEIAKIIGADKLCYQTIGGLTKAIGLKRSELCMACLTGKYPTCLAQKLSDKMKTQKTLKTRYWEREG